MLTHNYSVDQSPTFPLPDDFDSLSFLNRDQIVLVNIKKTGVSLTTILGTKVLISGSPETVAKFIDQLTNSIDSNFVSVPQKALLRWQMSVKS
ncbi:hypothetical protein BH20VER3_BH20VER3_09390 [soil metagenome]